MPQRRRRDATQDGVAGDVRPGRTRPVQRRTWKTVQECEQRRYRSAIRLLLAFAKQAGIEASSLLTAPNETVVLCIEGASKPPLTHPFRSRPHRRPPPRGLQEDGSGGGEKKLKASREKAYRLFLWAMEQNPSLKRSRTFTIGSTNAPNYLMTSRTSIPGRNTSAKRGTTTTTISGRRESRKKYVGKA